MILTQQKFQARLRDEGLPLTTHSIHLCVEAGMPVVRIPGKKKPKFDWGECWAWVIASESKGRTVRRAGVSNPNTLRQMKLKMQECRCEACGWGASRSEIDAMFNKRITTVEMHHMVPVRAGGCDTPDNLIALCPQCHWIADRTPVITQRDRLIEAINQVQSKFRAAS